MSGNRDFVTQTQLKTRASTSVCVCAGIIPFFALSLWQATLFPYATGVALFQSRLAHAGYTAAPPAVWPESASAEAIANAAPTITP